MSPSAYEYLQHILDETAYIIDSTDGLNKAVFMQDETLKRAYVRKTNPCLSGSIGRGATRGAARGRLIFRPMVAKSTVRDDSAGG
jgi:hypothetical protein